MIQQTIDELRDMKDRMSICFESEMEQITKDRYTLDKAIIACEQLRKARKKAKKWKLKARIEYKRGYDDGVANTPFTDTEEAEKKAYQRGYEDRGKKIRDAECAFFQKGLEQGMSEAWECAKKAWSMSETEFHKIFNTEWDFEDMLDNLSAIEVVQKIKEYESTINYHDDFATALEKMYEYEERQTEKTCDNCLFHGHCQYYGKTLTWLLGDKNEQTGEKVCKSWKPNGEQMRKESHDKDI